MAASGHRCADRYEGGYYDKNVIGTANKVIAQSI